MSHPRNKTEKTENPAKTNSREKLANSEQVSGLTPSPCSPSSFQGASLSGVYSEEAMDDETSQRWGGVQPDLFRL